MNPQPQSSGERSQEEARAKHDEEVGAKNWNEGYDEAVRVSAEVLKPLVELLEQVLSETVDAPTYPDGPCLVKSTRDEIKEVLAKVKDQRS